MGIKGKEWKPHRKQVIQALKDARGRITVAAKILNVEYRTLKKLTDNNAEYSKVLADLRNEFEYNLLAAAEACVYNRIAKDHEEPALALKAAMYTLNSKGQKLGWQNTYNSNVPEDVKKEFDRLMNQVSELQRKIAESK